MCKKFLDSPNFGATILSHITQITKTMHLTKGRRRITLQHIWN